MLKAIAISSLSLLSISIQAAQIHGMSDSNRIDDQYIVVVKESMVSEDGVNTLLNHYESAFGAKSLHKYRQGIRGAAIWVKQRGFNAIRNSRLVDYVEADRLINISEVQEPATWGLDRLDQRDLNLDQRYQYEQLGNQVHAYIIDTGVRSSHSDFAGRVLSGFTAINDGIGAEDCNGHGTHVAGTVGSANYGVAKGSLLHPIRVLDCNGSGSLSGVIAGIEWVTNNHIKPAVANMSLGGGFSQAINDAVSRSIDAGVTYVVAAGNESTDACSRSPASADRAITVGATDNIDRRPNFSNFGSCIDIFAPGVSITSTWHTSDSAINTISGTSMASPHVAGAVALYLENHPNALPSEVNAAIINNASDGLVVDAGQDSANKLLYSLFDSSTQNPEPEPEPEPVACADELFSNSLAGTGTARYEPGNNYYYSAISGLHKGVLDGPENADFDLYLWKYSFVFNGWNTVASSFSFASEESIEYSGSPGYYVWRIESYQGEGAYDFCLKRP